LKVTTAAAINFPFERGKEYRLAELIAFENELWQKRRANELLSKELRAPTASEARSWIKLRLEELVPVLYYARYKRMPDDSIFVVMPKDVKSTFDLPIQAKSRISKSRLRIRNGIFPNLTA
jgi:hypothetical protein